MLRGMFDPFFSHFDLFRSVHAPAVACQSPLEEDPLPAVLDSNNPFGQADCGKEMWTEDGTFERKAEFTDGDILLSTPNERIKALLVAKKLHIPIVEQFLLDYTREIGSAALPANHQFTARLELIEPVTINQVRYLKVSRVVFNEKDSTPVMEVAPNTELSHKAVYALLNIYDFVGCNDALFLRVQRLWSQTPQNRASDALEQAVVARYGFNLMASSQGRNWVIRVFKDPQTDEEAPARYSLLRTWSGRYRAAGKGSAIVELEGDEGSFVASYGVSSNGRGSFEGRVQIPHGRFIELLKQNAE